MIVGKTTVDVFESKEKDITKKEADLKNIKVDVEEIIKILTSEEPNLLKNDDEKSIKLLEIKIKKIIRRLKLDQSSEEVMEILKAHIFGYGMLQPYIDDESVTNISVSRYDDIWIQRGIEKEKLDISFEDEEDMLKFIRIIKSGFNGELNRDNAIATFDDPHRNLRISCAVEPIAQNGSTLVIRKHQKVNENLNLDMLIKGGMLSEIEASFLVSEISNGKNVIFSGKGNSGKTTILRAVLNKLPAELSIQVMEESRELKLTKSNVFAYEVRRNTRGKTIGLGELIEFGLRNSIDMYVFGESRGEEAMTLCDSGYSGHQILTSLHAPGPREVTDRFLINMKKSGTDIPTDVLKSMIHTVIDYVVHMKDLKLESIFSVSEKGVEEVDISKYKYLSEARLLKETVEGVDDENNNSITCDSVVDCTS